MSTSASRGIPTINAVVLKNDLSGVGHHPLKKQMSEKGNYWMITIGAFKGDTLKDLCL